MGSEGKRELQIFKYFVHVFFITNDLFSISSLYFFAIDKRLYVNFRLYA